MVVLMAPTALAIRLLVACLLMVVVVQLCVEGSEIGNLNSNGLQTSSGEYGRLSQAIDCNAACGERCKAASRRNRCLRACGTCCARCNCVPPGTYGNRDVCPCYANMKTHGNRLKCP